MKSVGKTWPQIKGKGWAEKKDFTEISMTELLYPGKKLNNKYSRMRDDMRSSSSSISGLLRLQWKTIFHIFLEEEGEARMDDIKEMNFPSRPVSSDKGWVGDVGGSRLKSWWGQKKKKEA